MKIRVLIVEDEPIIRMGIASVMPWEELGCEKPLLAENGKTGLQKALEGKPQLIISDIRMPQMDGLEMAQQLVDQCPGVKIIFLTGYKEFEYAQKAISFGVSEYILKPVDQEELLMAVKKLIDQIRSEEALEAEREQLEKQVRESLPILRDKFISSLLFGNMDSVENVYEKMEYFSVKIEEFAVLALVPDSFHELEHGFTESDILLLLFMIQEQVKGLLAEYGYSAITFQHEKVLYAILSSKNQPLKGSSLLEYGNALGTAVKEKGRFSLSVGISHIHSGASSLRRARREADKCAGQSYYWGAGSVIYYDDLRAADSCEQRIEEPETEPFFQALSQGRGVKQAMEELCRQLQLLSSVGAVKSMAAELISGSFRQLMGEYGEGRELEDQYDGQMEKLHYARSVRNYIELLTQTGDWMEEFIQSRQRSRTQHILDQAIQYMRENCCREVTLEEVADKVYVSKWYFSKLFRKEKGIKFSDYMSALRIEQAQKIIREDPTLRNYEVADRVGFTDVRYFSQLFRKITGKTPSEFRG